MELFHSLTTISPMVCLNGGHCIISTDLLLLYFEVSELITISILHAFTIPQASHKTALEETSTSELGGKI